MMAPNMRAQPSTSLEESLCPKITHPARTEILDSRLQNQRSHRWIHPLLSHNLQGISHSAGHDARIENRRPRGYNLAPFRRFINHMAAPEKDALTKNWIQDIFAPVTTGEKKSIIIICTAKKCAYQHERSLCSPTVPRRSCTACKDPPVTRTTAPATTGLHFLLIKDQVQGQ